MNCTANIEEPVYSIDATPSAIAAGRIVALDALRGFNMFWIMGGQGLVLELAAAMTATKQPPEWLKTQMSHTHWVGFSCWDLINPLFLFISGVSMAFSFEQHLTSGTPHRVMYRRMASRFVLLWIFGMMAQGDLLKLD